MENNKKNLENYKIRETEWPSRIGGVVSGLALGTMGGTGLVDKVLRVASKMYNYMQTSADFNFYNNLNQFYNNQDKLETVVYATGIVVGGAIFSHSLFFPKYEICKKSEEDLEED